MCIYDNETHLRSLKMTLVIRNNDLHKSERPLPRFRPDLKCLSYIIKPEFKYVRNFMAFSWIKSSKWFIVPKTYLQVDDRASISIFNRNALFKPIFPILYSVNQILGQSDQLRDTIASQSTHAIPLTEIEINPSNPIESILPKSSLSSDPVATEVSSIQGSAEKNEILDFLRNFCWIWYLEKIACEKLSAVRSIIKPPEFECTSPCVARIREWTPFDKSFEIKKSKSHSKRI